MHARHPDVRKPHGRRSQGGAGVLMALLLAACSSSADGGAKNAAPVASPGAAQNGTVGTVVTLDGSGSADPEGAALTYYWGMTSRPAGSAATLSTALGAQSTFTPDVAGEYVIRLIVSDGVNVSAPRYTTIAVVPGNLAPVASAGLTQTVAVNTLVTLDGTGSSDANGDSLTFSWTLTTRPDGSAAVLAAATTAHPTFTADVAGTYVATLVVNDGDSSSDAATVTVTAQAGNLAPVADPGPATTTVVVTRVVTLDGSASADANGDALTYAWSITSAPAGSTAALAGETSAHPTFTPIVPGDYVVQLVVNDGKTSSAPASVTVTATAGSAPVASAGPAQNVIPGTLATLDGSGSSDADHDPLTYAWTMTSRPPGSAAALADAATAHPSFTPEGAGSLANRYVAQLVVNDGFVDSAPSTVTITTTGFTASYELLKGYFDPTVANTPFLATAAPVSLPPIRFFSGGSSAGNLRMYYGASDGSYAIGYNGSSVPSTNGTVSTLAVGATVDLSLTGATKLTRFVSMPYSPVAGPVTATATFTQTTASGPTGCQNGQIVFADALGKVLLAQNACVSPAVGTATVTFTDPTNTEVYVLYNRAGDTNGSSGTGGLRLRTLVLSSP